MSALACVPLYGLMFSDISFDTRNWACNGFPQFLAHSTMTLVACFLGRLLHISCAVCSHSPLFFSFQTLPPSLFLCVHIFVFIFFLIETKKLQDPDLILATIVSPATIILALPFLIFSAVVMGIWGANYGASASITFDTTTKAVNLTCTYDGSNLLWIEFAMTVFLLFLSIILSCRLWLVSSVWKKARFVVVSAYFVLLVAFVGIPGSLVASNENAKYLVVSMALIVGELFCLF